MMTQRSFPSALGLFLLTCSTACFSTGDTVCETSGLCGTGERVPSCDGLSDCIEQRACGETVFCVPDETCDVTTRPRCEELMGAQGPGFEVDECLVSGTCEELAWCGGVVVCDFPSSPPLCMADEDACGCAFRVASEDECMAGTCFMAGSTDSCGQPIFCIDVFMADPAELCRDECEADLPEACSSANSDVIRQGPAFVEADITMACAEAGSSPCFSEDRCFGELVYCITACPQGARQLDGPEGCEDPNDCFFIDHTVEDYGRAWCTYDGDFADRCEAEPTCAGTGFEIGLAEDCPADATCEFVTECGSTIHCANGFG
ncbi:MAG: hypothetical protein AAF938_20520 [Myxococcota bacterium]